MSRREKFFAGLFKAIQGVGDDAAVQKGLDDAAEAFTQGDDTVTQKNDADARLDTLEKGLATLTSTVGGMALGVFKMGLSDDDKALFAKMSAEEQAQFAKGENVEALRKKHAPPAEGEVPLTKAGIDAIVKAAVGEAVKPYQATIEKMTSDATAAVLRKRAEEVKPAFPDTEALVKTLGGLDVASQDALLSTLAATTKQLMASALLTESGGGNVASGSAYQVLAQKARELQAKTAGMTFEQAFDKAYTDPANRETVTLYKSERRTAIATPTN